MNNKNSLVVSIIVHYQAPEECINLVKQLQSITWPNHKIVVVDNQSSDASISELQNKINPFSNTTLVQNPRNNGYGGGINYGITQCKHLAPAFFHIINTDIRIINPEYISDIITSFSQVENAALIGPAVLDDNKNIQNTIMPFISFVNIFLFKFKRYKKSLIEKAPRLYPVDVINGVCFVLKSEAFFEIKGFDEEFFMYGEEHDFCYRLKKAGYRSFFWSGKSIIHTHKNKFQKKEFTWRDALIRSNQVLFLKKHKSCIEAFIISFLFAISYVVKKLRGHIFRG
ncbi:MAG: glycosyltransferase family 2 protein, partial [bacterium]